MGRLIKEVGRRKLGVRRQETEFMIHDSGNRRQYIAQLLFRSIKIKLQASILEPVIAVVILVISMAMVFTILTRTNITPIVQAKNKANELISVELYKTISELDFLDKEEQVEAFKIIKKVEQVQNGKTLNISIQVFDIKQKKIVEKQIVIANPGVLENEK